MNYRKIMSMLLILVLVAPWLAPAAKVSAGASYPVPGNDGLITIKRTDDHNVEVSWSYADSDSTANYELKYRVFVSASPDLNNMTEIREKPEYGDEDWVLGSDSQDGTFSKKISGLSDTETFYYNVMVVDRYGLEAAYQMNSFNPSTQLSELEQFNEIKIKQDHTTNFIQEVIDLFSNEQFIDQPDFKSLSEDDQIDIAVYLLNIDPPTSEGYQNKEQVQYLVQLALQALELPRKIGGADSREVLDTFFNKQADRINYFDNTDPGDQYELIYCTCQ